MTNKRIEHFSLVTEHLAGIFDRYVRERELRLAFTLGCYMTKN